jgi:hypothetical protein
MTGDWLPVHEMDKKRQTSNKVILTEDGIAKCLSQVLTKEQKENRLWLPSMSRNKLNLL